MLKLVHVHAKLELVHITKYNTVHVHVYILGGFCACLCSPCHTIDTEDYTAHVCTGYTHLLCYSQKELTADDVKFVGRPITTDDGSLLIAFFAQFPDSSGVVDGTELANAVNNNMDEISDAVSSPT